LSAKAPDEKIPFISESDLALYQKYREAAFEVQVGLHELTGMMEFPPHRNAGTSLTGRIGHGCGKLLQETSPGVFNFDVANPPISPLTGKPITTWYKPGQTWGSVFGGLAGAYEV
jgi:dipeptidyl-peptidase-3